MPQATDIVGHMVDAHTVRDLAALVLGIVLVDEARIVSVD